jgi:hypothetical protein
VAYALYSKRIPILDRHFKLTEQLRNTYTPSSKQAVEKGITICRKMIKISPDVKAAFDEQERNQAKVGKMLGWERAESHGLPNHLGFKQLAIILEKRGEFEEAIEVAKEAQSQGWNGDWEKRIARCTAKIERR